MTSLFFVYLERAQLRHAPLRQICWHFIINIDDLEKRRPRPTEQTKLLCGVCWNSSDCKFDFKKHTHIHVCSFIRELKLNLHFNSLESNNVNLRWSPRQVLKNRKIYIAAKLYLFIWNGTFRITAILHFYLKHLETYPLTSKTLWFVI